MINTSIWWIHLILMLNYDIHRFLLLQHIITMILIDENLFKSRSLCIIGYAIYHHAFLLPFSCFKTEIISFLSDSQLTFTSFLRLRAFGDEYESSFVCSIAILQSSMTQWSLAFTLEVLVGLFIWDNSITIIRQQSRREEKMFNRYLKI